MLVALVHANGLLQKRSSSWGWRSPLTRAEVHRGRPSGALAFSPAAAQIADPLEPISWAGVNLHLRVYMAE